MLWGFAESPVPGGMALDGMGGLGGLWMRGSDGAPFRNPRPIDPRMAKLGLVDAVRYYLYGVFWVMFICVMVGVSV
jgi:hypothetical protein